ncbi:DUF2490 domain-containing protein [uncultured Cytophaga sp.]|uniref:DUF2490 domain-containing protein n=1 Tax=uncultured Cytophaga sp. TaxID=160238 RepID=UPI00262C1787|nr:DUF2490 domain-containing protein [uncultured Cytophaga sp.]
MYKKILLLMAIIVSVDSFAQSKNIYHDNFIWTQYVIKGQFAKKWSASLDIGYRSHNYADKVAQYYVRPFITYQISSKVNVLAGYAYFESSQYLNGYQNFMRPENRLVQRLTVTQNVGRVEIKHRYRIEERFIRNAKKDVLVNGSAFSVRLAYQIYAALPLNNTKIKEKTVFLFAFNELFVSFGKNIFNNFDQNRLAGGVGYQFTKGLSANMYYQNIYGQQSSSSKIYAYNTFGVTINQTIDFTKKEDTSAKN